MLQSRSLSRLLRPVRRALTWLWQQEGTAGQRARGLAAGVFCGCFPFFGLQTLLGIGLASVVRGNHLLAAAGTGISNPFTYVPLYWFNFQLGSWLMGPGPAWPGLAAVQHGDLWAQGWSFAGRLLLGSTVSGGISAAVLGLGYWHWLQRQEPATPGNTIRSM